VPPGHRNDGAERPFEPEWLENFTSAETQCGAPPNRKWHIGPQLRSIVLERRARQCPAVQGQHGQHCRRGIGAAAPEASLHRDPLDERETRATGQMLFTRDEPCRPENEVVTTGGYTRGGTPRPIRIQRRLLVTDLQCEATRAPARDECVRERHRLEHRGEVVKTVGAARTQREPQVQLCARVDFDLDRWRASAFHRTR
jgi:hypothetical protein